jgi:hypothetical protein
MAESVVTIQWATSTKRQSAYATATPDGDLTFSHPFEGADMGEHTVKADNNAALYGKGHEFATRNELLSWDSMFKRSFVATSKVLGWAFAFHCGKVTTVAVGSGFSHVFEYQDPLGTGYYGSGRQLPVVTIMEKVTSGLTRQFPSMLIKAIEITAALNDWVKCTVEMQGSGMMTRIAPSAFDFPDSTDPATGGEGESLLRLASLAFSHGPSGAEEDMSCDVRSFRFRSEYQLFENEGYCPGSGYLEPSDPESGQIRGKLEMARRAVVFEFVITASADNTVFERLEGSVLLHALLTVTGRVIDAGPAAHGFVLDIPRLKYTAVPIGTDGDLITYSVQTIVFYDQGLENPWTATVVNKTPTYLAAST